MKNSFVNIIYMYMYNLCMYYQNVLSWIEDIMFIANLYVSAQEHMQAIDVLNEAFKSALDLEFYLE